MALETGTYVNDLVTTNPLGSDDKSEGDNHLRLLKSVLKATFPNATRAFRFPTISASKTGAETLVAADENKLIRADATAGAFTLTLPLGSAVFAGWSVPIMKTDSSSNAITIDGNGAETINGAASVSLSSQFSCAVLEWDGAEWKIVGAAVGVLGNVAALDIASQAEAEAGTANDKGMTPLRTAQAMAAAPTGFRNRIINGGAPFVNQRGNQVGLTDTELFADRWKWAQAGAGVVNGQIGSSGGSDWLEIEVTTADASIGASDSYRLLYHLEANNIVDFLLGAAGAKQVTLSFKHKHTKEGTYCIAFRNAAGNRSYLVEYTQDVADTEETETITLTLDTSGTWATGANTGLRLDFSVANGANTGSAGSWQGSDLLSTANQVNGMDAIGNKFRIRDVQLELGAAATSFERRPYGTELALCQRYYEKSYDIGTAPGTATGTGAVVKHADGTNQFNAYIQYAVRKRAAATITAYNPNDGTTGDWRNTTSGSDFNVGTSNSGEAGFVVTSTSIADNNEAEGHWTADAEL